MSAIAGIIHLTKEPVPFEHGRNIMKELEKFPADDIQVWHKHNAFIGNHAQWITPESVGEKQPFYDSERQCVITADAIIDNREELFEKLQVERSKQKIMPDSQLILLAYYKWGEESPKHLVGDFAYMIWDERNQKLFGARDFSGSRTLYYYKDHERFAFCTTIMPLFTLPGVKKELNEQWMAEFLAIPGMNEGVDTSLTPFLNIQQLSPSFSISIKNQSVILNRYCYINSSKQLKLKANHEYIEAFREVFSQAVSSRLRTHREVGAHLSGGLDSGSVVSFAALELRNRNKNKQLNTYSYIPSPEFEDWTPKNVLADERPYIKSTVKFVGNINDHYYDFKEVNPLKEIDDWLNIMEMPYKFFANSVWIKGIFQKAYEHNVGVLLNGGRGNLSISWGSALSYYALLLKKLKWLSLIKELNLYSNNRGGSRYRLLPVIGKIAFPNIAEIIPSKEEPNNSGVYINPELARRTRVYEKLSEHGFNLNNQSYGKDAFDARRRHFQDLFSWNATNTLGTKLSLSYSLWKRDPTNDLRVVNFCLSLPEEQYVQGGLDRALIRRSTVTYLPDKVRMNQKVRGVQGADCIHRMSPIWNELILELESLCLDSNFTELVDSTVLKSALFKIKKGPENELSFSREYQILMHSLISYKFLKTFN